MAGGKALQFPGDLLGGAVLLVGQFRVLVQIPVKGFLAGLQAVVAGQDLLGAARIRGPPPYSASRSRRLVLVSSRSSLPSPDMMVLVAYRVKPLSWP